MAGPVVHPEDYYTPTTKPNRPVPFWKKPQVYTIVVILCITSYFLGAWQHNGAATTTTTTSNLEATNIQCNPVVETTIKSPALDFTAHHKAEDVPVSKEVTKTYPACDIKLSEYTPCQDQKRSLKFSRDRLIYRERHCPEKRELLKCRVPAPFGYRAPFKWPVSRDLAWYANVPHKELTVEKAIQNWIRFEGERFRFPGGGTMFPNGADAYIDDIGKLINLKDGSIRTAIDTGCGVIFESFPFLLCFYFWYLFD